MTTDNEALKLADAREKFELLERAQLKRTFTTCSGCGAGSQDYKEWADITVTVSDGRGTKYVPIGKYCPRCKGRTWAYRGHGMDNPELLFTIYELSAAMGEMSCRTHPYVFDNPIVIDSLKKGLSHYYNEAIQTGRDQMQKELAEQEPVGYQQKGIYMDGRNRIQVSDKQVPLITQPTIPVINQQPASEPDTRESREAEIDKHRTSHP